MLMLTFPKDRTKLFCYGNPFPKIKQNYPVVGIHSQKTEQNCSFLGMGFP